MKLILDFLPILVFYVTYQLSNIFIATGTAIAITILQLAWMRFSGRRIEPMQWLGLGIIVIFGGATLLFQDETFIKWKPTVLYGAFATALAVGRLRGTNYLQTLLKGQLVLPPTVWQRLNTMWVVFFVGMAVLNLAVAYTVSTELWVKFKLFGSMGLTFAFVMVQAFLINRELSQEEKDALHSDPARNG